MGEEASTILGFCHGRGDDAFAKKPNKEGRKERTRNKDDPRIPPWGTPAKKRRRGRMKTGSRRERNIDDPRDTSK
ncbi:Protein of unknown function [Gryllus bimaculatus]|nr:Protein of unknown function [Gryllus bimaculatus]